MELVCEGSGEDYMKVELVGEVDRAKQIADFLNEGYGKFLSDTGYHSGVNYTITWVMPDDQLHAFKTAYEICKKYWG